MSLDILIRCPEDVGLLLGISRFRGPAERWALALAPDAVVLSVRRLTSGLLALPDRLWVFAVVSETLGELGPARLRPPLPGRRRNAARYERAHIVDTLELSPTAVRSWRALRPELGWAPWPGWDTAPHASATPPNRPDPARVPGSPSGYAPRFDTIAPSATIPREVPAW